MLEYVVIDCMEPQDCFSISVVIMIDLDIIILLLVIILVIIPSFLFYHKVVKVLYLHLFTPVVGYDKMKARMYLHILLFYIVYSSLTLIHALDEYMSLYMYPSWPECMRTCFIIEGSV